MSNASIPRAQLCTTKDFCDFLYEKIINDYDGVCGVGGDTGEGKSVAARLIAREIFPRLNNGKSLNLRESTFYSREMLKNHMATHPGKHVYLVDEAIGSLFNRQAMSGGQVELVKLFNVIRDKNHVILMNIPNFWEFDCAIRNRVRVYIYLKKRAHEGKPGIAYIFAKERMAFNKDSWNYRLNERLERKGEINRSPNFYGAITIPDLSGEAWFVEMEREAKQIKEEQKMQAVNEAERDKRRKEKLEFGHFFPHKVEAFSYSFVDSLIFKFNGNGTFPRVDAEMFKFFDKLNYALEGVGYPHNLLFWEDWKNESRLPRSAIDGIFNFVKDINKNRDMKMNATLYPQATSEELKNKPASIDAVKSHLIEMDEMHERINTPVKKKWNEITDEDLATVRDDEYDCLTDEEVMNKVHLNWSMNTVENFRKGRKRAFYITRENRGGFVEYEYDEENENGNGREGGE